MAVPARENADDPGPPGQGSRKSDALSPGWADVRRMLVISAEMAALAVTELARCPVDPAAMEMAALTRAALESAVVIGGRWAVDDAVLSTERARAYAQGAADCKAAHCRLEVLQGGRGVPGPH